MIRLNVVVEGQTEETFVREMLAPHLGNYDVFARVRAVLTSRDRRHRDGVTTITEYRGGLRAYGQVQGDLQRWLREDQNEDARFTTMLDLYALPTDFPGYAEASGKTDPYERTRVLEEALREDIGDRRFVPYLQVHEFEALLFSDIAKLGVYFLQHSEAIAALSSVLDECSGNPELIDDGPQTAPSRRIVGQIPGYHRQKSTVGPQVAAAIGLEAMRKRCRHFGEWLDRLEQLGTE